MNGVLKLLTNNISNRIFTLADNTLQLLHKKHPAAKNADEILMSGKKPCLHPVLFESIN